MVFLQLLILAVPVSTAGQNIHVKALAAEAAHEPQDESMSDDEQVKYKFYERCVIRIISSCPLI